jgi:hypothetical protein
MSTSILIMLVAIVTTTRCCLARSWPLVLMREEFPLAPLAAAHLNISLQSRLRLIAAASTLLCHKLG